MTDTSRYDTAAEDDKSYEAAIARRDLAYSHWQAAVAIVDVALEQGKPDMRPYVRNMNQAQAEYEHARDDWLRAREWHRALNEVAG